MLGLGVVVMLCVFRLATGCEENPAGQLNSTSTLLKNKPGQLNNKPIQLNNKIKRLKKLRLHPQIAEDAELRVISEISGFLFRSNLKQNIQSFLRKKKLFRHTNLAFLRTTDGDVTLTVAFPIEKRLIVYLTREMLSLLTRANREVKIAVGSGLAPRVVAIFVPSLIRKYGYPVEEHQVTTRDQYVLTMHRIPHGRHDNMKKNRPVAFVMHGLLSSSADFILSGPDKALAYILADEGYDVWMGNARGNRYSRQHMYLHPRNLRFWKFSWDEIGNIDLPTMIDYVLEKTNKKKLHYLGHSQGTTSFWVMCSLRPEYNKKIVSMHALAPVAYLTHNKCLLLRALAPFSRIIATVLNMIGKGEFLGNKRILKLAGAALCKDGAITQEICSNIMFLLGGWNSQELNRTMIPLILAHTPAGASVYQLAHYGQVMASRQFRRFNHGLMNSRFYGMGTFSPPQYDLYKVTAPVFFHYSLTDPLAHVNDVERLGREIGNLKAKRVIPMRTFTHFDFVYAMNARSLLYDQVISDMRSMG